MRHLSGRLTAISAANSWLEIADDRLPGGTAKVRFSTMREIEGLVLNAPTLITAGDELEGDGKTFILERATQDRAAGAATGHRDNGTSRR